MNKLKATWTVLPPSLGGPVTPPSGGGGGSSDPTVKELVYLYGDVAENGTTPSGGNPYHQMLLTKSGQLGLSEYAAAIGAIDESGVTVNLTQQLDSAFVVTAENLANYDAVHLGCIQRVWTAGELAIWDTWIRSGGSIMTMADSASGGAYYSVGAQNTVAQNSHGPLLALYGMEYYVDQSAGNEQMVISASLAPEVTGGINLTIEGEGVSPLRIYDSSIDNSTWLGYGSPFNLCTQDFVAGGGTINHTQNVTLTGAITLLAGATPGSGRVLAWGDRQFFWNQNSPGADITYEDNQTALVGAVKWLCRLT